MDNLPMPSPEIDPAVRAFTRLGEKVDLLEAAIAGLAARRDAAPDYSETLGKIEAQLGRMREAINTLGRRPAIELTPYEMARQISEAGAKARAEDGIAIAQARGRMDGAAGQMERLVGVVATAREQRRRFAWAAGGGLLAGMLLWSFLPGVILRTLPQGWHMPEAMAAHIIGEPTLWEAGSRLMQADSPRAWNALAEAVNVLRDNDEALGKCQAAANKVHNSVRCTFNVEPRK
ncbi:DUF6118 family protein [Novosphingobium mangrovi (ex Huang et al. 2023)]|uniref:DUF6118 family protein n=1 Tax=Novosphingobium mangrovi (ex Huang et al. 2023) TaxID=2976432 RepID=A0ABT2I4S9_9SPHN|nr:DUF6118 family protein [Novosphingobium mangrovi (ex Huang et al. 2023)]MCT2399613.1 DUF6118 family protein [Novosphingobium mangrovi (ex Huang et al. 2023)]